MTKTTIDTAKRAAEHPILLETPAQLAHAEQAWKQRATLGIDTEFVRERTWRADLGLIQISDGETAWLVDPLALDSLEPVTAVLTDPAILKLLHSGSEDLEVLLHSLGVIPEPLVDTQIACAMLGQPLQLGYHHALSWLFGLEIEKVVYFIIKLFVVLLGEGKHQVKREVVKACLTCPGYGFSVFVFAVQAAELL